MSPRSAVGILVIAFFVFNIVMYNKAQKVRRALSRIEYKDYCMNIISQPGSELLASARTRRANWQTGARLARVPLSARCYLRSFRGPSRRRYFAIEELYART